MWPEIRHPSVKRTRIAAFQLAQDGEHHDAIAPREQSAQVAQCFAQRQCVGALRLALRQADKRGRRIEVAEIRKML